MTEQEDPMREFARALFRKDQDDEQPDEEAPARSNVVPREGHQARPRDDANREFVRRLFNTPD
jgi:hypothetical protein